MQQYINHLLVLCKCRDYKIILLHLFFSCVNVCICFFVIPIDRRYLFCSNKKGIFRFGHHGTVVRLLGILGLFKDEEPLKADNFERHTNRKFRNSRIGPFSTNIAFVLYECTPGVTTAGDNNDGVRLPPTLDRYMVELLFKEIPERFPFCSYDLCSYDEVRNHYKRHIDLCDLKHVCSRHHDEL